MEALTLPYAARILAIHLGAMLTVGVCVLALTGSLSRALWWALVAGIATGALDFIGDCLVQGKDGAVPYGLAVALGCGIAIGLLS